MIRVKSEEEAIAICNKSRYGLQARTRTCTRIRPYPHPPATRTHILQHSRRRRLGGASLAPSPPDESTHLPAPSDWPPRVAHPLHPLLTLQGCVFTRDINTAIRVSDLMETGTVQINGPPARGPDHFPFQARRGTAPKKGQRQGRMRMRQSERLPGG